MGLLRRSMPMLLAGVAGAVAIRYLDQARRARALGTPLRPGLPEPSAPPAEPMQPTQAATVPPPAPAPPPPPPAPPPAPEPPPPAPDPPAPPAPPPSPEAATAQRAQPPEPEAPPEEPDDQPTAESPVVVDAVPELVDVVEDLISPRPPGDEGIQDATVVETEEFGLEDPLDDGLLAERVRTVLAEQPGLLAGGIEIEAMAGTVYLRGEVDRVETVGAIEERAQAVEGVLRLESLLHLRGTPRPA